MVDIRVAKMNDCDRIAFIEKTCFPEAEAASHNTIKKRMMRYMNHFYLLEEDGEVVSAVFGPCTDNEKLVDELYENENAHDDEGAWQMIFSVITLPEYQGKGYAGKLLSHVISESKKEGRKGVVLTCKDRLKGFYERFGFVSEGVSASVHGGAVWYDMRLTL